jgi:hypothetical protein
MENEKDFPLVPKELARFLEVLQEMQEGLCAPLGFGPHRQDFTPEAWEQVHKNQGA